MADKTETAADSNSAAQTTTQPPAQPAKSESVADLKIAYPDLTAQIAAEAATAERERILGIESLGMPGHDALIAEMKADGKTTPEQAAMRVVKAEKETRKGRAQAIKDVELHNGNPAAAPASQSPAGGESQVTETATTDEGLKAEWEKSAKLQAEFPECGQYVAFKKAEASGRVKVLKQKSA